MTPIVHRDVPASGLLVELLKHFEVSPTAEGFLNWTINGATCETVTANSVSCELKSRDIPDFTGVLRWYDIPVEPSLLPQGSMRFAQLLRNNPLLAMAHPKELWQFLARQNFSITEVAEERTTIRLEKRLPSGRGHTKVIRLQFTCGQKEQVRT